MYKGLIYALSVMYQHLANAGTSLSRDQINSITAGAKSLSDTAPMGVIHLEAETPADQEQLRRAQLIDDHIEAMSAYLLSQEIF